MPVWVGELSQRTGVTAKDVENFANVIRKTVRYQQDNLRDGIMPALQTQYEFLDKGTFSIACKVQDDMGREGWWTGEVVVE